MPLNAPPSGSVAAYRQNGLVYCAQFMLCEHGCEADEKQRHRLDREREVALTEKVRKVLSEAQERFSGGASSLFITLPMAEILKVSATVAIQKPTLVRELLCHMPLLAQDQIPP